MVQCITKKGLKINVCVGVGVYGRGAVSIVLGLYLSICSGCI